jgi:hypothetical protein
MGTIESVVAHPTIVSYDEQFIATQLYQMSFEQLTPTQQKQVNAYKQLGNKYEQSFKGVLDLTEENRNRLFKLAGLEYNMGRAKTKEIFKVIATYQDTITEVEDDIKDLEEPKFGTLIQLRKPALNKSAVELTKLRRELAELKAKLGNNVRQLSDSDRALCKEREQLLRPFRSPLIF